MSKYIVMSDEIPEINENVIRQGFKIIKTDYIHKLLPFERRHADMQCLRINDCFFVLKEAVNLRESLLNLGLKVIAIDEYIHSEYPQNVLLNAVYLNNKLYCRTDVLSANVKEYCKNNDIELINVKQGYTKCSVSLFNNCFITADKGIFEALSKNGEYGLFIESGDIELKGVDYGFIGGCVFYYNKTAFFSGDISKHKSYRNIKDFLNINNINMVCLSREKLYDIGGFIVI